MAARFARTCRRANSIKPFHRRSFCSCHGREPGCGIPRCFGVWRESDAALGRASRRRQHDLDQDTVLRRVTIFRLSKRARRSLSMNGASDLVKQSRFALWLCRMTLALCTLIFASVSPRFVFNTVQNGAYLRVLPSPSNVLSGDITIPRGSFVHRYHDRLPLDRS